MRNADLKEDFENASFNAESDINQTVIPNGSLYTSRYKNNTGKRFNTLGRSANGIMPTLKDNIEGFLTPRNKIDLSKPITKRQKKYDASKKYYEPENLTTLMRKIQETPKHMIDYKHNLETTMYKKKLGLEKINSFQLAMHQANIDYKSNTLPKLREKSFDTKISPIKEVMVHLDKESTVDKNEPIFLPDHDLDTPQSKKNKMRFRSVNYSHATCKDQSSHFCIDTSPVRKGDVINSKIHGKTLDKAMLRKCILKPIDTSKKVAKENKVTPSMRDHMEQLSSILGDDFSPITKYGKEPGSAEVNKHSKVKLEKNSSAVLPSSVLQKISRVDRSIEEAAEEYEVDDFKSLLAQNIAKDIHEPLTPLIKNNDLDQDKIDDISFINILMYVDGEDKGVSIANDKQFDEICKLMDEYYGLNEKKILNKYEVWKKYIRNLKMQRQFEERNNEKILSISSPSKTESKDEMISRYSAFLSKKWFSKADPFLKAKYKDYFKESEVKWGPNMIFKRLNKETEKLNKLKGLVEHRLNKESVYVNNRIKVDAMSSPRKQSSNSNISTADENYDKFLKMPHHEMCHY